MLLHTICGITQDEAFRLGVPITLRVARFVKFILTEIFPGGRLPTASMVETHATNAGFQVSRVQSLQPHYAKTLDHWAAALENASRRRHRGPVAGGLRPLHEVPHRVRGPVPRRVPRCQTVHPGEVGVTLFALCFGGGR